MNERRERYLAAFVYVVAASYASYAVVKHADQLELWARIARDEGRKRWAELRAFRAERNRVLFDAYVATREAADGCS